MIRILLLVVAVLILLSSFLLGFETHRTERPPYRAIETSLQWLRSSPTVIRLRDMLATRDRIPGVWARDADLIAREEVAAETVAQLQALGYLGAVEDAPDSTGVTIYDAELAHAGLNLYNSGHAPEAILMTMTGEPLHSWSLPFEQAFPDAKAAPNAMGLHAWRRVHLYENGDLLAIFEGQGIIRIDRESNLLWADYNGAHHDLWVADSGEIYVLTRHTKVDPRVHDWKPILEDTITVLAPEGSRLHTVSVLDAVIDSGFAALMESAGEAGDVFHTNSLEILDGRHEHISPHFQAGNALVSMREPNFIGVIDLKQGLVVWGFPPFYRDQHDPTFLETGELLLFDNNGPNGYSRVLQVDPATQEINWSYSGSEANGFFTSCCGTNRRLPNGNTLIAESDGGRAFEVTPDNEIVWEFYNPNRGGEDGDLIGRLYEVQRIDPEFVDSWLPE